MKPLARKLLESIKRSTSYKRTGIFENKWPTEFHIECIDETWKLDYSSKVTDMEEYYHESCIVALDDWMDAMKDDPELEEYYNKCFVKFSKIITQMQSDGFPLFCIDESGDKQPICALISTEEDDNKRFLRLFKGYMPIRALNQLFNKMFNMG